MSEASPEVSEVPVDAAPVAEPSVDATVAAPAPALAPAPDLGSRVARLEAAVVKALNVNLDEFDPAASVAARKAALEAAKADAVAVLEKAVDKAIEELSVSERFARLEKALEQGVGVKLDG